MIRTMVVDDEKLVRRGFISLVDWEAHGMRIVGEAGDGRSALELLSRMEMDLLITDITMPGMSGFDLIAEVRRRYPHIWTVVLTCHHEFDYVQEALRSGAIDYIVKTLLEMDSMGEVMDRIVSRIRTEEQIRQAVGQSAGDPAAAAAMRVEAALVLCAGASAVSREREALRRHYGAELEELEDSDGYGDGPEKEILWLLPFRQTPNVSDLKPGLAQLGLSPGRAVLLTELGSLQPGQLRLAIPQRIRSWFFYEAAAGTAAAAGAGPEAGIPKLSYSGLLTLTQAPSPEAWTALVSTALELRWALHRADWDAFIASIEGSRPAEAQLRELACRLGDTWGAWFPLRTDVPHPAGERGRGAAAGWEAWRRWFRDTAHEIRGRTEELELSREVMGSLIRAVLHMTGRLGDGSALTQESVALEVNMSRSYFSQCFKRFAGRSFGEVLRDLRLEKAAQLLLETGEPVYEIAARVGFEDEKYFSRMFRSRHGRLPSEFRSLGSGGGSFV